MKIREIKTEEDEETSEEDEEQPEEEDVEENLETIAAPEFVEGEIFNPNILNIQDTILSSGQMLEQPPALEEISGAGTTTISTDQSREAAPYSGFVEETDEERQNRIYETRRGTGSATSVTPTSLRETNDLIDTSGNMFARHNSGIGHQEDRPRNEIEAFQQQQKKYEAEKQEQAPPRTPGIRRGRRREIDRV